MSQIDRRLKNVQQADLTESRVNDDFVYWLRTWGSNILLVVLLIAAAGMGYYWWEQKQQKERDDAWTELAGATLPAALVEVGQKHQGKDAVSLFAQMKAADTYLQAVLSGRRFDRDATATDAAITPELREQWLKEADRLYAQVATATAGDSATGKMGFYCGALFGRAAVAEDLGDLKAAEGYLHEIQERTKGTDFALSGDLAAKRIERLTLLAQRIDLPPRPVQLPPSTLPNLGAAGSTGAADDIVRQLQGGAPSGISLTPVAPPTGAPGETAPATAPAPAPTAPPAKP